MNIDFLRNFYLICAIQIFSFYNTHVASWHYIHSNVFSYILHIG